MEAEPKLRARPYDIELFDGDCPLCAREVSMLRRLDRHSRIKFVDIAEPEFDAAAIGISWDDLMRRIHGRLPNGSWVEGVEVFRRLYGAVGFAPLVAATRLPLIRHGLDLGYELFARHRLRLTGRCDDEWCAVPRAAS